MSYQDIILNEETFISLYEKFSPKALRLAGAITCNTELAADAVQESFIRVYKYSKSFDDTKNFEPWFFRIVSNESKRILKNYKNYVELDDARIGKEEPDTDRAIALRQSLYSLKLEQRELITYKYLFGYSEEDIAKIIKKPLGTVKSRLYKAREDLRKAMEKEGIS